MNFTAKYRKDFWFIYHGIPRHIKRPVCQLSKYYDRFPQSDTNLIGYIPTIDDPFMIELAGNIMKKVGKRSQKYRAGYILKLVQMGYTYSLDRKTYGDRERYQFPVCTSFLHIGDCEDGAYLGAGLSKLCGIDQAIIHVYGHMAYGVNVDGFGCKFDHDGKKYLWCETTSPLPPGMHINDKIIFGTYSVEIPPEQFIKDHTYKDSFDKYPLN